MYTYTMQKVIFGIFAHPDDEAFGPSGTMLREVKSGAELHLIMLTAGQNGLNPDNVENLTEVRLEEWHHSGQLLGASSMHHLGYVDGELDNRSLISAADKIETIVQTVFKKHSDTVEIEFISMDTNGITGHVDHIVASYAAHLAFYKLKQASLPIRRLRLACIPREQTGDQPNTEFVFMEPGRLPGEIDEIIDNSEYIDEITEIMRCHHTQREDCEKHFKHLGNKVAINHFIIKH